MFKEKILVCGTESVGNPKVEFEGKDELIARFLCSSAF